MRSVTLLFKNLGGRNLICSFILLFLSIFNYELKAQTYTIELGVSYDQFFAAQYSSDEEAEAAVYEAVEQINCVYDNLATFKVVFELVKVQKLNLPENISAANMRRNVSAYWINVSDLCNRVDVCHHLTDDLPGVDGQAGGGQDALCGINNFSQSAVCSISEWKATSTLDANKHRMAHEIGHHLITSTDEVDCTPIFDLMCKDVLGADCNQYNLDEYNITALKNNMINASCVNVVNVGLSNDCNNCSNSIVISNKSENVFNLEYGCIDPIDIFDIETAISNNCADNRNFKIRIEYNSSSISLSDLDPKYQGPFPTTNGSPYGLTTKYETDWFPVGKNEGLFDAFKAQVIGAGSYLPSSNPGSGNSGTLVQVVIQFNPPSAVHNPNEGTNSNTPLSVKTVNYKFNYNYPIDKRNLNTLNASELKTPDNLDPLNFCNELGHDVYLNGNFYIDMDQEYCNTNFFLEPGSKIYVNSGKTLALKNCTLESCGEKWQGIELLTGANIKLETTTIKNAIIGIKAHDRSSSVTVNSNSRFDFNDTGVDMKGARLIEMSNTIFTEGIYGIRVEDCIYAYINKCTFTRFYTGIDSKRTSLTIDGGTFKGKTAANGRGINLDGNGHILQLINAPSFSYWQLGVNNLRSWLTSSGSIFSDNNYGINLLSSPGFNHEINDNHFSNSTRGINIAVSPSSLISKVTNSTFDGLENSINITNQGGNKGWSITSTFTNVKQRGITLRNASNNYLTKNIMTSNVRYNPTMISLEAAPLNVVGFNNIAGSIKPAESLQSKGIFLSSSTSNIVDCNYLSGGTYGLNAWGDSNGNITQNTFIYNNKGLYCGLYPSDGNANTGAQLHKFNLWENLDIYVGAQHLNSDQNFLLQNKFTVNTLQNTKYRPNPLIAVTPNWFTNATTSQTPTACVNRIPDYGYNPGSPGVMASVNSQDNDLMQSYATGNVNFSNYSQELNFTADQHVYNLGVNAGTNAWFTNISPLTTYMAQQQNADIGRLHHIQNLILTDLFDDVTLQNHANNLKTQLTTYTAAYETMSVVQKESGRQAIADLSETMSDRYQQLRDTHEADLASAQYMLNGITETVTPAINHVKVLRILAAQYYRDALLPTEIIELEDIASQCPLKGGDAVYMARGVLDMHMISMEYDDSNLCQTVEDRSVALREANMTISPNPSSGDFVITAPDKIDKIVVTDINGSIISTINNISEITYTLDAQSLKAGIYIIKVQGVNDQVEWVSKIVKI